MDIFYCLTIFLFATFAAAKYDPMAVTVFTVPRLGLQNFANKLSTQDEVGGGQPDKSGTPEITLPPLPDRRLIPRKLLKGAAERSSAELSPDGNFLSYKALVEGVRNVWIMDLRNVDNQASAQTALDAAKPVTFDTGRGIQGYVWSYLPSILLYIQDADGDENYRLYRLNVTDVERPEVDTLYGKPGVRLQFLGMHRDRPEILVVGVNDRDPRYFDVHWINIVTNETGLMYTNEDGFDSFTLDNSLSIRMASLPQPDGSTLIMEPVKNESSTDGINCIVDWIPYRLIEVDDTVNTGPAGFDKSNKHVYWFDSAGRDKAALYKRPFNMPNHTDEEFAVLLPEKSDITGLVLHPTTDEPILAFENYDVPKMFLLDAQFRKDFVEIFSWDEYTLPQVSSTSQGPIHLHQQNDQRNPQTCVAGW